MKHSDFKIGTEFTCGDNQWRTTDIGTRVIVAICLDKDRSSWYIGPPYAVTEVVFDEDDRIGCHLI